MTPVEALKQIRTIVYTPTKDTPHRRAYDHFAADFDAIRKIIAAVPSTDSGVK